MNIIIGICFIVLVCSTQGHNEVCRATDRCNNTCEKYSTTITNVKEGDPILFYDKWRNLRMKFDGDTTISPNAFSTLNLTSSEVVFKMPDPTERNASALHTLTLHPDSFAGLSNAYYIVIQYANINLCGRTLNSITNLPVFKFTYCGFTEVPTEMLESTPNLVGLSFESNFIRIIRSNAFLPLKSLTSLYLKNNGIICLELGWFNGLHDLEWLDLTNNHFTAVSSIFNGLTNLRCLYIDNAFDDNGFNLDILQNLTRITQLGIGGNGITALEPNMFNIFPQLWELSLSRSLITSIPKGVFDKLKSLNFLDLSGNDIKTIEPGAFCGLSMFMLRLDGNKVDRIIETGTFNNITTKYLILGKSSITELKPRAFDGLSVGELDLRKNKLTQIGAEDFFGLETEVLDLRANKIRKIASNAFNNSKVMKLRLEYNPIDMGNKENWGLPNSTKIITDESIFRDHFDRY